MRTLKFRSYDTVEQSYCPFIANHLDRDLYPHIDVQQWTGLLSKDGVEIYEGDIVEGGFEKHRGVVSFGLYANPFVSDKWTGYQGFYIKWSKERAEMTRGDMGYWTSRGMETAIEVIGNIQENPELLEANQ